MRSMESSVTAKRCSHGSRRYKCIRANGSDPLQGRVLGERTFPETPNKRFGAGQALFYDFVCCVAAVKPLGKLVSKQIFC